MLSVSQPQHLPQQPQNGGGGGAGGFVMGQDLESHATGMNPAKGFQSQQQQPNALGARGVTSAKETNSYLYNFGYDTGFAMEFGGCQHWKNFKGPTMTWAENVRTIVQYGLALQQHSDKMTSPQVNLFLFFLLLLFFY